MTRVFALVFAVMIVLIVAPVAGAAERRAEIGRVDRVQGAASAAYDDARRALRPDDPVYLDDRLTTASGARLRVRLADETEITLGENAELVVDRFVYDPDAKSGSLALNALTGAFLFAGGLIEGLSGATVEINTPVATLGVRGTTAWGGRIDDSYGIFVLDGTVRVATDGGEVRLEAGMGTSVADRASPPGPPKRWPPEKASRALATVEFSE